MANKKKRGDIDFDGAFEDLLSRYGSEQNPYDIASDSSSFESSLETEDFKDVYPDRSPRKLIRKGPKKSEMVSNEKNLPLIKILNEMSNEYFKHDDSKRASKVKN